MDAGVILTINVLVISASSEDLNDTSLRALGIVASLQGLY